ncbi:MAG TPA: hypothetical protein VNS12_10585 [Pelagibacterium sp.]|uniref:DUF6950 family protein n=1 Tax=Pelagibacterium sp. TaxID=1967288 RepID=UPI002B72BD7D|nr:hypothetical protein [Pelagibacterium sp.]HWJ88507.1 hypothetical protein [Pelagibacterium sp.]
MRHEDWRKRLGAYVSEVRATPFAFGTHDCWLFVTGAVEAMTGTDHAAKHRGRYKTARGAIGRVLKPIEAKDMGGVASHYFEPTEPAFAQIGDIMAIPTDDVFGYSLGILNGEQVLVVTATGIGVRDRADATRAFRV